MKKLLKKKGPQDCVTSNNILHYTPEYGDSVLTGFAKEMLISPCLEDLAREVEEEESLEATNKDAEIAALKR